MSSREPPSAFTKWVGGIWSLDALTRAGIAADPNPIPEGRTALTLGSSFSGILDAARTGAEWAWTALYRDLAPAVLGYFRMHGLAEAEDQTSEVFLGVVRNLHTFTGDEPAFRSWVFVIAHRRLQDERRRLARHPVDPSPLEGLDRPQGNAEDEALASLSTDEVRSAFAKLSPDQRDVLLLRIVADLSVDDVAEAVGKRPGAVKALQRRGLAALAAVLPTHAVSR